MQLTLDEVRRLTGPNLLSDYTGAIADVFIEGVEPHLVLNCWQRHLNACQQSIGWSEKSFVRHYEGGASMSISAPMDQLYSACDLLELAWDCCVVELQALQDNGTDSHIDLEAKIEALEATISEEQNPALLAFIQAASAHNVRCLADDDEVSLGMGPSARVWPVTALPNPDTINWEGFSDIPLALITGTNGKSTSVRLAAEIAKAAGLQAGVTSTDFIKVGDHVIDEGDYSGPGGARMLLRDNRTEIAFLEVARGGLLRRGLPVYSADAALVTNVASDHLGQYGINTVDDIAQVKLMLAKAIHANNTLVLNADDERLQRFSVNLSAPICWFSRHAEHPLIKQAIIDGRPCVYEASGNIVFFEGAPTQVHTNIAHLSDIPMTVNGAALHNIQNALGVVGLCRALGINNDAIATGLANFGSNALDNPGRTNIYDVKGTTVVVDFAHNTHSMQAVINMVNGMKEKTPFKHIKVLFSHGGDRSNNDITDVTDVVCSLKPDTFILAELEVYLRGRAVGEVSDIVEQHLLSKGVASTKILRADSPLKGAELALTDVGPQDLVLLFTLSEREEVQTLISRLS
jgi:cyanophycin synthetase